jgi:hypothetical protein
LTAAIPSTNSFSRWRCPHLRISYSMAFNCDLAVRVVHD